jgi:GAF domain-containing protein
VVAGERRLRILSRLVGSTASDFGTKRLCEVSAEVTGMSGAGIMLMAGDLPQGSLCTSDGVSALIEDLQYALGEGPCVDAFTQDRAVLEPDLANPRTPRWLAFTGPALDAGVRALFGFPLRVGAVRLGALNLHRGRPGPLSDDEHADALVMADVVAQAILVLQADAPLGGLAAALTAGAEFHHVVQQAAGMVAAQLDTNVTDALIRLRAHAFGNDLPLTDVARAVVARRLRFSDHPDDKDTGP